MEEDCMQDLDTITCCIFQIHFYDKHSKIQNKIKLNKKAIETLFSKLFVLDNQEQNETVINEYADERDITTT